MSPVQHAKLSVRDFGGSLKDYLPIHEFIDSTKNHLPDSRHRIILHNSFGMELCVKMFGSYVTNSDNKLIDTREIARRHILQDCNTVPTLKECLVSYAKDEYMQKYNNPNQKDIEWLKLNI